MAKKKDRITFKAALELYRMKLHMIGRLNHDTELRLAVIEEYFGRMNLEDVDHKVITTWAYTKFKGRSPNTINRNLGVVNAIMNNAMGEGLINQKVKVKKLRVGDDSRDVHLEVGQVVELVEWATREYGALTGFSILMACDTGMRFGEMWRVTWGDWSPEWVRVQKPKRGTGKTKSRLIPTSPRLVAFMQQWKIYPNSNDNSDTRVLESRWGTGPSSVARTLNRVIKEGSVALGFKCGSNLRWHDLRHTFAYQCAISGADIGDIKELLGHSCINITMRYRGYCMQRAAKFIREGLK